MFSEVEKAIPRDSIRRVITRTREAQRLEIINPGGDIMQSTAANVLSCLETLDPYINHRYRYPPAYDKIDIIISI